MKHAGIAKVCRTDLGCDGSATPMRRSNIMAKSKTLSAVAIERKIRNRLTLIALCADGLEQELAPSLSFEQRRQLALVSNAVIEIKSVLDQLTVRFQRDILLLKLQLGGGQLIGVPPDLRSAEITSVEEHS